jgi:very-short-patch-repair endonuclease
MGNSAHRPSEELNALAEAQHGWIGLPQLANLGITREQRRAHIAAGRWLDVPQRGVVVLSIASASQRTLWLSLARVGPSARLGGASALEVDGLKGYAEPSARIWVPKGHAKHRVPGVTLHETRRWKASQDATVWGLPRSLPGVAVAQGVAWAKSLRQAALIVTMSVQQRLVGAQDIAVQVDRLGGHPFRRAILATLTDVVGGAHSMNELDFAAMCRARGIPEPERQVRRRTSAGHIAVDACWEVSRVVVEIQGAGHLVLDRVLSDEVRLLDLASQGDTMVPVTTATLRADPEPFFRALATLLRSRGWRGGYVVPTP